MKLYTSVIRQQDGTWVRDPMPTSLREAKKSAQFNRCMAGIMTQIMPANEERKHNDTQNSKRLPTQGKDVEQEV